MLKTGAYSPDIWDITYDNDGEIAEGPGMAAVFPCTFDHPPEFKPTAIVWLECGSKLRCEDRDTVFNSGDVNATKSQLRGRMIVLEPDLAKKDCTTMIWNLQVSDTGSYKARVLGEMDGLTYRLTAHLRKPLKVTGMIICMLIKSEGCTNNAERIKDP